MSASCRNVSGVNDTDAFIMGFLDLGYAIGFLIHNSCIVVGNIDTYSLGQCNRLDKCNRLIDMLKQMWMRLLIVLLVVFSWFNPRLVGFLNLGWPQLQCVRSR